MTEKKDIQSKEAQEALDSINKMQQAGLKHVLPTPIWLGAILGVLVGTQIALLGADIRTYNTILVVLIIIMAIAIINKTQSAGAKKSLKSARSCRRNGEHLKVMILTCLIRPESDLNSGAGLFLTLLMRGARGAMCRPP